MQLILGLNCIHIHRSSYGGKAFTGARLAYGAGALAAEPEWSINAWSPDQIKQGQFDTTLDLVKGVAVPIRMEYRKPDGNGNVELQWSLIGNATVSLADATAAAAAADVAIVAVGGSDQTTNEGCDRAELDLPGKQLQLVQVRLAIILFSHSDSLHAAVFFILLLCRRFTPQRRRPLLC